MEKNLDITKSPYREHVLPVPWHFVEVPLYILYYKNLNHGIIQF